MWHSGNFASPVVAGVVHETARTAPWILEVEHTLDMLQLQATNTASSERQHHSPEIDHQLQSSEQQPPTAPYPAPAPATRSIDDLFTRSALAIIQQ
jgi:hypothetical protein